MGGINVFTSATEATEHFHAQMLGTLGMSNKNENYVYRVWGEQCTSWQKLHFYRKCSVHKRRIAWVNHTIFKKEKRRKDKKNFTKAYIYSPLHYCDLVQFPCFNRIYSSKYSVNHSLRNMHFKEKHSFQEYPHLCGQTHTWRHLSTQTV